MFLFLDAKKLNLAELVKNADNAEGDVTDENSFGPGDARDFTVSYCPVVSVLYVF